MLSGRGVTEGLAESNGKLPPSLWIRLPEPALLYDIRTGNGAVLRYETERAWFSRLLQHPDRKWSGSIFTTRRPHGANRVHMTGK